ncbi:hypothetical protein C6499_19255 [Candidatus Poribacteria bacterium]|nr:MAG: hypothetical protein C6499_19255 [Candidatus Poribacteria bacterium]
MQAENLASITLRDYQTTIVESVVNAFDSGERSLLVSLPTGTGKTIVFCEILKRMGVPCLIVAHRDELINQAVDKLRNVYPAADIGIVKAKRNETEHQITVASVQTLARKRRIEPLRPDLGLIITDECHHAAANSYQRIYHRYGLLDSSPDPDPMTVLDETQTVHLGVTATPMRNDKRGLANVYDRIAYQGVYADFVKNGHLCDLHFEGVVTSLDLSLVKDTLLTGYGRDFKSDDLSNVVNTDQVSCDIFDAWNKHANDRKRTLAFCVDRDHAKNLFYHFAARGVVCGYVDGDTPLAARKETIRRFADGQIKVLFNILVFTEGFDLPSIDCILLARPSKSPSLLTQMIGRGTRIAEDKTNCLVLDVAHSHRVKKNKYGQTIHAGSLIDLASLFYPPLDKLADDDVPTKRKQNRSGRELCSRFPVGGRALPDEHFIGDALSAESVIEYLRNYTPKWSWERNDATDKQRAFIRSLVTRAMHKGILDDDEMILSLTDELTKGQAKMLIDKLTKMMPLRPQAKREAGPNTCPQCNGYKNEQYEICYPCHQKKWEDGWR